MFLWRAVLLLCAITARSDDDDDDDYDGDTANWFENDGATTFNGYADAFVAPAQRPRAGRLTIVVASYACPWDYGPYSQQLRELAGYWADQHDVVWVGLSGKAKNTQYGAPGGLDRRVGYRGGGLGGPVTYVSGINGVLRDLGADALVMLCDLNRIGADEDFDVFSVAWFPSHVGALDLASAHALRAFDAVASLSPTDAEIISAELPSRVVRNVPHAVDARALASTKHKRKYRETWSIPQGAFAAVMVFGNYASEDRKGVDVAALAWSRFLKEDDGRRQCVLYVRAVIIKASVGIAPPGLPVAEMLARAGAPLNSFRVDTRELEYRESLEILAAADVVLHPSRAEGFGVVVLEAQHLGVPVISTKHGAMADYTVHGIAVEPLQEEWMNVGYVATPSVRGVAAALAAVKSGACCASDRQRGIDFVERNLSIAAVGGAFDDLLARGREAPVAPLTIVRYGDAPTSTAAEWSVVADASHVVDRVAAARAARAAAGDSVCLQTLEIFAKIQTPSAADAASGRWGARPLMLVKSKTLADVVEAVLANQAQMEFALDAAVGFLLSQGGAAFDDVVGARRWVDPATWARPPT